jgi:hypothetical protein
MRPRSVRAPPPPRLSCPASRGGDAPGLPGDAGDRPRPADRLRISYLRDRDLQREIEESLNVVEAWNGADAVICYGRGGEISTNRHEEVEMTALCLRILQAALVYVNTLMLQDVLAEEEWAALLGPADRRGLTPLFWQHVRPYGEVRLDMGSRLRIGGAG